MIYEDYTCMQKVDKDIDSHKMQRSPPSDGERTVTKESNILKYFETGDDEHYNDIIKSHQTELNFTNAASRTMKL